MFLQRIDPLKSAEQMEMALKKVKGNIERMFDKNLTDLVRGIRNNKENEVRGEVKSRTASYQLFLSFSARYLLGKVRLHKL